MTPSGLPKIDAQLEGKVYIAYVLLRERDPCGGVSRGSVGLVHTKLLGRRGERGW